jgi:hypothetical protein
MNPDRGAVDVRTNRLGCRRRKIPIDDEKQRKQCTADVQEVTAERHG